MLKVNYFVVVKSKGHMLGASEILLIFVYVELNSCHTTSTAHLMWMPLGLREN